MISTKVTRGTNWNRQLTLWKVVATRFTYLCFWCHGWCSLVWSKVAAVVNYGWLLLKQGTYMSNCKILHPKLNIFECLNFFAFSYEKKKRDREDRHGLTWTLKMWSKWMYRELYKSDGSIIISYCYFIRYLNLFKCKSGFLLNFINIK